jgi:putative ABC transport system permease protein
MRARLRSFLAALFQRSSLEQAMDAELQVHIQAYTADLVRSGMSPDEAARRARIEFGGLESIKEECREARGLKWPDEVRQNVRYAFRALRKAPGFTAAAVLSLALGIGVNTAVFSVVEAALIRPLPYADPGHLVAVYENHVTRGEKFEQFANANFLDLRSNSPSFEDLAAHMPAGLDLTTAEGAERIDGAYVTANMFPLLGVRAFLGRALVPDDGELGKPRVILLSFALWRKKFAGDPHIVGRPLAMDGASYQVIGVMPPTFRFPGTHEELWLPLRFDAQDRQQRSNHNLDCIGRLKPGANLRQAQSEASFIARGLQRDYPDDNAGIDFNLVPLRESLTHSVRGALLVLVAAVALLLLVACANVGNLILTRSTVRRRELAVRATLGASRWRLIRQMLTESLCLALLGGITGLVLCFAVTKLLRTSLPPTFMPTGEIRIDAGVLSFGLAAALAAGLLCAFSPAFLVAGADLQSSLAGSSRSATGSGAEVRTRSILVACEVSLTLILLIGAGLLLRSFVRLMDVDPGLSPGHVLAVRFALPRSLYSSHAVRLSFYQRLLARIDAIPGVRSAALITSLPLASEGGSSWFIREGRPTPHPEELIASNRLVSERYFRTLGIPLRAGRWFSSHDGPGAALVAVVNESVARRFWPGESPIGKRFQFYDRPWVEIVGIVGDVRQAGLDADATPEIYRPYAQDDQGWLAPRALAIQTQGEPLALAAAVRREFRALDSGIPIYGLTTMDALLEESVASRRLEVLLVGAFGCLALVLACIGVYGVVAYVVAQRGKEVGIRMALGATPAGVTALMLRQGLAPVLTGLVAGLAAALALSRFLSSQLYLVKATDALTFALVASLMVVTAVAAAYFPARRAARTDPNLALRQD